VCEFPEMNVFHSRHTLLKPKYCADLRVNRVLLCDESHYGANEGGLIEGLLDDWKSSYKVDSERMDSYNVYILC
jgi:hypothetical protein